MANLMQTANDYVELTKTMNISDLDRVSVTLELFNKVVEATDHSEAFSYDYIVVDEVEYRVPKSVLKQLKAHIKANPLLKEFSVSKEGTGINTQYTVIPLSE